MKFYLRALELSPGFPPSQGNLGYPYLKLLHDPWLDLLRGDPAFVEIVANAKAVYQAAGFLPSATAR